MPCTGIKKGYFNTEQFLERLENELLPLCHEYPGKRSIICLDNASVHCDPRIQELIELKGSLVKYLPPYSPEYNAIELTFSILKAWMRCHFESFRAVFEGDFEVFLHYAVEHSGCDTRAVQHLGIVQLDTFLLI